LERVIIISKIESQSTSTVTSIDIWPKNTERGKRRKLRNVSNAIKKNT